MPLMAVSGAKGTVISWVQSVTWSGSRNLISSSKRKRHWPFRFNHRSRTSCGRGYSNCVIVFLSLRGDRDQDPALPSILVVCGKRGLGRLLFLAGPAQRHHGAAKAG